MRHILIALASMAASFAQANVVVWEIASGGNGNGYEAVAVPGGVTWSQARLDAEARGGHLVSITSVEESTWLLDNVASDFALWRATGNADDFLGPWIGLSQNLTSPDYTEPSGGWEWITGETSSFVNWATSEPNNAFGTEHFASLFSKTLVPSATWNDYPDNDIMFGSPISYIVEYPIPSPSTMIVPGCSVVCFRRRPLTPALSPEGRGRKSAVA